MNSHANQHEGVCYHCPEKEDERPDVVGGLLIGIAEKMHCVSNTMQVRASDADGHQAFVEHTMLVY